MQTPVNLTTAARSELKDLAICPNIGAKARGPHPCAKVLIDARLMTIIFQGRLQFWHGSALTRIQPSCTDIRHTYQRIMRVVGRLRHEDTVGLGGRLDEMMRADVCHQLRAWVELVAEHLLDPAQ